MIIKDKIISVLKQKEGYLSGEDISRQMKISRAGIWKNVEELRKEGYAITAVPHLGYQFSSSPDKLLPREIKFNLKTKVFGKTIHYFDTIDSTMDTAFRFGIEGAEEGAIVCAETQTKGRGRQGRSWNSPKGRGVYFSLLLRPKLSATDAAKLTLLSAVAVTEAIEQTCGLRPSIKWPNDLLIDGKKVAGFLTEMSAQMDYVRFVVIGVGINVNTPLRLLPVGATSLRQELNRQVLRVELLKNVLTRMEYWYLGLSKDGFSPVLKRWKELSATLGRKIRIVEAGITIEGEAIDLDQYGGLIIRTNQGETVKRMTGDVIEV